MKEILNAIHQTFFGGVEFLDLLVILMLVDIFFGVMKAIKNKNLMSRNAWLGYARKIGTFAIIIVANVIDTILELNGLIVNMTVLFYIATELLSILENSAEIGMRIPKVLLGKVKEITESADANEEQKN